VIEFLQRIENTIAKRRLFSRGQKILVAVSGGVDSMVLLHVLDLLAKKNRRQICVAHFNHRLRRRASDADEKLVRHTAKKLGLKFFNGGADVKGFAAQSKISIEMAARKLRHEFLAKVAHEQKIPVIALAHHADDQVELFFIRLLRGSGGEGLAGMKWRSLSPADKEILLDRPQLDFPKADLLAFAREIKSRFREDVTNFSDDFLRNRIRNELLPLLRKKYQPAVDRTVLRLMDLAGAEAEFVAGVAANIASQKLKIKKSFDELPLAIQRRILWRQLVGLGIRPEFEMVEQLREVAGKSVSIAAGVLVQRDASGKIIRRQTEAVGFNVAELELKLSGRVGRGMFTGRKFSWAVKKSGGSPGHLPRRLGAEFFDANKIGGEIILRHWRAGDRFQPIGMKSAVKLQDLFVNAKIPAAGRHELVLAATVAGEIFWVEGLRIGEKFKLTPATKRQLRWNWSKIAA
jgi:tRNA(Ile)-lysidine synthase